MHLVLYVFHTINENVIWFCKHNIFESPEYQFIIICNSLSLDLSILQIPSYATCIQRPNTGYDFGGWSRGLACCDISGVDRFIFINSSVKGPFLPPGYTRPWPTMLTDQISDSVKLAGCTINCLDEWGTYHPTKKSVHIQSYAFCTDRHGSMLLRNAGIFSLTRMEPTFMSTIINREIRMSRVILEAGFNISCLLPAYKDVNFLKDGHVVFLCIYISNSYFTKMVSNPWDVLFIKTNRSHIHRFRELLPMHVSQPHFG